MAQVQNLYIDQGTTYALTVGVADQLGNPKDLTEYTVASQMRKSYNTSSSISFNAEVTRPTDGEVTISLTPTQTSALKAGRYVYDIEITGPEEVVRVLEGIVVVNPEVTK